MYHQDPRNVGAGQPGPSYGYDRPADYPQPPQPPRKKSRGWLIAAVVVGAILVLCAAGAAIVVGTAAEQAANVIPDGTATPREATVGIGQPARDGKFEFTVTKARCGKTSYGNKYAGAQAAGLYCEIRLTVANIGDQAQLFAQSEQKAYDTAGRQYSTDLTAAIYANQGSDVWLKEVNPGNKISGLLIFDVAKGTLLDRVELHDSIFSGGVVVKLRG